jgi:glycerol-3-phosphate dehydrogenase (NAD(P)+)
MNITLLGAGSMGGALTFPFVEGGHTVQLYGTEYDRSTMAALKSQQDHPKLNLPLPDAVRLFGPEELDASLEGADVVILSVNTDGIASIMDALLPRLCSDWTLITVAKGFYPLKGTVYPITLGFQPSHSRDVPGPTC